MTDAEIVATYTDKALAGIVQGLITSGVWWPARLQAAKTELTKRKKQESK